MKFERFRYLVKADVELTAEEVEVLCELGKNHYDDTCRSAVNPGRGAFLNGAWNGIIAREGTVPLTTVETWTFNECNLSCKILEMAVYRYRDDDAKLKLCFGLTKTLHEVMDKINDEHSRQNNPQL